MKGVYKIDPEMSIPHGLSEEELHSVLEVYSGRWGTGYCGTVYKEAYCVLVPPETMDRFAPPSEHQCLDSEAMDDLLAGRGSETPTPEELEGFWRQTEECLKETVALGLYLRQPHWSPEEEKALIQAGLDYRLLEGPAILICPERCDDVARDTSAHVASVAPAKGFQVIFSKVFYHELAHWYMDRTQSGRQVGQPQHGGQTNGLGSAMRVLEESLANMLAMLVFKGEEYDFAREFTRNQPMEYLVWPGWELRFGNARGTLRGKAENWALRDLFRVTGTYLPGPLRSHFSGVPPHLIALCWMEVAYQVMKEGWEAQKRWKVPQR